MSEICGRNFIDEENKNEIVVYWSACANEENWSFYNLVQKVPYWLATDHLNLNTDNNRGHALLSCPAHQNAKFDTLVINFPLDIHIIFDQNGQPILDATQHSRFVNFFPQLSNANDKMTNRYYIQFSGVPIFFSEDSLEMELFPPYLHNVSVSQYAALTVGKFDIGKWFRPLYFDYMLWNNVREIVLKENDPGMYIRFYTNKRIKLQEFKCTDFIFSTARACESVARQYKNKQSLQQRYDLFSSGSTKRALLQEIKKNLL